MFSMLGVLFVARGACNFVLNVSALCVQVFTISVAQCAMCYLIGVARYAQCAAR